MDRDRSRREAPQDIQKEQRSTYTIVFDTHAEVAPQPYILGTPVSRETWTDCLVKSFALSRGSMDAQVLFFAWLEAATGLDIRMTMRSFLDAGGFDALSYTEQHQFLDAHNQVQAHHNRLRTMYETYDELTPEDLYRHFRPQLVAVARQIEQMYDSVTDQVTDCSTVVDLRQLMNQAYAREKKIN